MVEEMMKQHRKSAHSDNLPIAMSILPCQEDGASIGHLNGGGGIRSERPEGPKDRKKLPLDEE